MGAAGAQGPVGSVGSWTPYRDFTFGHHSAHVRASDQATASDIAAYMRRIRPCKLESTLPIRVTRLWATSVPALFVER
jgi:hypothetical protein